MQCVAIYCVEEVDLFRYNLLWLNSIGSLVDSVLLLSDENISEPTLLKFKDIFKNVYHGNTCFFNSKKIRRLITEKNVSVLVINALSVPDLRVVKSVLDYPDVKVVYLQHGLYVPYMKRTFGYYIKESKKVLAYLYYSFVIVRYFQLHRVLRIVGIFVCGMSRKNIFKNILERIDVAMVFSNYWKSWHRDIYKLDTNYFVIGTPDLGVFDCKDYGQSIIYCAQTLVEDGRIDEKLMYKFYELLKDYARRIGINKVVVKVHPRNSDKTISMFSSLGFLIEQENLPLGKIVVGHYSSLLPAWGVKNIPILIVELQGHHTPMAIRGSSSAVIDLKQFSSCKRFPIKTSDKLPFYFSPLLPEEEIIDIIVKEN